MFRTTAALGLLAASFGATDIAQAQYYPPYYQAPAPHYRGAPPAQWDIDDMPVGSVPGDIDRPQPRANTAPDQGYRQPYPATQPYPGLQPSAGNQPYPGTQPYPSAQPYPGTQPYPQSGAQLVRTTEAAGHADAAFLAASTMVALGTADEAMAELYELKRIRGSDVDVPAAIRDHAAAIGADFMVMGGYGHSRLREFILGGVTRTILTSSTIPVLMSH